MACGTPVIASNTSALPEVVGQAGILVNPTNTDALAHAMGQVLHSGEQQQLMTAAGLQQAAQFSWPAMARKLVRLYQELLKR